MLNIIHYYKHNIIKAPVIGLDKQYYAASDDAVVADDLVKL